MQRGEKYIELCKKTVLENIDTSQYAVFLFGSRARANHGVSTDIDIGIIGEHKLSQKEIYELKEKIDESIVPFNVDLVDFYNVEADFKKVALKNIIIWNKPEHINIS